MAERLQKILSQWGVASRRQAEGLIVEGRVRVNGAVAQLGQTADLDLDVIEVDGKPLGTTQRPQLVYLLLHKPRGVVSSCEDPQNRRTVLDLLPPDLAHGQGIHPVGRLDMDSTGALILTNDGNLTYRLTHPRHQIAKTYRVWLTGHPETAVLQQWRKGVMLDGRRTLPAQIRVISQNSHQTQVEVILVEGRNRQIRRIAESIGHPVLKLHRSAIGTIQLAELARGAYRPLKPSEIDALHHSPAF